MKKKSDYIIPFEGLKEGIHHFNFTVDEAFFSSFDYSEIEESSIKIELSMDKKSHLLDLNFNLKGSISCSCDICLSDLKIKISGNFRQLIKFSDEELISDDDEICFIPSSTFEIDVSSYIFEFSHLSLPAKKAHKEGMCDKNVADHLKAYLLVETNESTPDSNENIYDERWETLKKLKNN